MDGRREDTREDMFDAYPLPILKLGASEEAEATDLKAWLIDDEDMACLDDGAIDEDTDSSGLAARGEADERGGWGIAKYCCCEPAEGG